MFMQEEGFGGNGLIPVGGNILCDNPLVHPYLIILLGFRYLAPSTPSISSAGVAIGAGSALSSPASPIPRNPTISNSPVRRSPTGSSLAEASGSIGIVHSLSILYAFHGGSRRLNEVRDWNEVGDGEYGMKL